MIIQSNLFNKHLGTAEDTDRFYREYSSNRNLRAIITKAVLDKLNTALHDSEKQSYGSISNWDLYQADLMGYRRALREIILLLDLPNEENNDRFIPTDGSASEPKA